MKLIDKIHKLSLHGLTLSGVAALACLAVNVSQLLPCSWQSAVKRRHDFRIVLSLRGRRPWQSPGTMYQCRAPFRIMEAGDCHVAVLLTMTVVVLCACTERYTEKIATWSAES